ncbi:MAG: SusC/RagA family TonB-linked outer membrane protein [Gemmatimonadaceae bacterium]
MISQIRRSLALAAAIAFLPAWAGAQDQALISGEVRDRATQQPLADAQVLVVGTQRGARTDAAGQYRIVNVAPGSYQLRAIRLGYLTQTQSVTVGVGASATANFILAVTVAKLDEVVVSATGVSERRRESGVNTATLDTSDVNMAAVQNFSDVLSSRAAGVVVQQAGGTTGGGSRIRIRGSNSVNLSNDPLLIVDGIRVNNASGSLALFGGSFGVGGQEPSRFNDINPEDIESVEVIKGPAAASLYGTAAANGVIRVQTKRGKAGKTVFSSHAEYGTLRNFIDFPSNFRQIGVTTTGARTINCNIEQQVRKTCTPKPDSLVSNNPIANVSPFRNGWRESFGLNASGGGDVATYYVGGDFEREEGVYDPSFLKKHNYRANLRGQLRSNLDVTVNAGYLSSRLGLPQNDNNGFGAISGAILGKAFDCGPTLPRDISCGADTASRGYFNANLPSRAFFIVKTRQDVEHLITSLNSNWQPFSWLTTVGTIGYDLLTRFDHETVPANFLNVSSTYIDGYRTSNRAVVRTFTGNYAGTGAFSLRPWLRSVTTAGVQYGREDFTRTDAYGQALLPGTQSLAGTSKLFAASEVNSDVVTVGALAIQRFEFRDRLFVSASVRQDKNSAFGKDLAYIRYPAFGLSWVVGEESFFPRTRVLNSLRLRAAYGSSGQRPNFREADKYFDPVAVAVGGLDVSGVTLGGAGNAELKPEYTIEREGGFDAGMFDDRLGVEFTWYNKSTSDALIGRRLAPSLGATTTRSENIGKVRNRGYEYLVNAKLVDAKSIGFDLTVNGSLNDNKVVNLGADALGNPLPPIIFGLGGNTQRHQNGYPLGAYFGRRIESFADKNGDGFISRVNCQAYGGVPNPVLPGGPECEIVLSDTAVYLGTPFGRTELTVTPTLNLFNMLKIQALFDHRGGLTLNNGTAYFRCNSGIAQTCLAFQSKTAPLLEQAQAISTFMGTRAGYFEKADFWKLRELSFTVIAPRSLSRQLRTGAVSLTVSGRNLKTWTDYTGFDPELNVQAQSNFNTADFLTQAPVRYWTTRLNVTF